MKAEIRKYNRVDSIVFSKTKEKFGGLSNMAGGYPLEVNSVRILTSEALYQACRFPLLPEIQRVIIEQASPMTAKMKSKPYRHLTRPDWNDVRANIMRWCLRVKLAQNMEKFGQLLLETDDQPIVEESRKDDYWGAKPFDDETLVGKNVLGRLLRELRDEFKSKQRESFKQVEPLSIPNFLLDGRQIQTVSAKIGISDEVFQKNEENVSKPALGLSPAQSSLFDQYKLEKTVIRNNKKKKNTRKQ